MRLTKVSRALLAASRDLSRELAGLRFAALGDNVVCKLSGLAMRTFSQVSAWDCWSIAMGGRGSNTRSFAALWRTALAGCDADS